MEKVIITRRQRQRQAIVLLHVSVYWLTPVRENVRVGTTDSNGVTKFNFLDVRPRAGPQRPFVQAIVAEPVKEAQRVWFNS